MLLFRFAQVCGEYVVDSLAEARLHLQSDPIFARHILDRFVNAGFVIIEYSAMIRERGHQCFFAVQNLIFPLKNLGFVASLDELLVQAIVVFNCRLVGLCVSIEVACHEVATGHVEISLFLRHVHECLFDGSLVVADDAAIFSDFIYRTDLSELDEVFGNSCISAFNATAVFGVVIEGSSNAFLVFFRRVCFSNFW